MLRDCLAHGRRESCWLTLDAYRSEAKTVPNLLVALTSPANEHNDEGFYEDYPQGYYADGAYTAVTYPSAGADRQAREDDKEEDVDPQEAYYSALCARFAALSSILQESPSAANKTSHLPPISRRKEWRNTILRIPPENTVLAQIQQDHVILGLDLMEDILTASNLRSSHGKNIGAWVWGLLARCREIGMMGSEEVGVLRKLAKKAVWLLRRMAAGEVIEEERAIEEPAEGGFDDEDTVGADIEEETDLAAQADTVACEHEGEAADEVIEAQLTAEEDMNSMNDEENSEAEVLDPDQEQQLEALSETLTGITSRLSKLEQAKERMLSSLTTLGKQPITEETAEPVAEEKMHSHDPLATIEASSTHTQQASAVSLPETAPKRAPEVPSPATYDKESIHATLDMIVTIVGEFYGQRDLLDGRLLWDEMAYCFT